jgi:hypothetical protein
LLFVRGWRRAAALGTIVFISVFLGLLVQGWIRGLDLECGCFGKWDPAAGHPLAAIFRDVFLLGAAVVCYRGFAERA